jgi:YidC/Oxa1 family membrane protein insertase
MDSARFVLAIILMIAVIVVTNLLFGPAPRPDVPPTQDTTAVAPAVPGPDELALPRPPAQEPPVLAPEAEPAAPMPDAVARPDTVFVESPLYRFGFSAADGALLTAQLLNFESFTAPGAVDLVPEAAGPLVAFRVQVGDRVIDLSRLPVRIEPAAGLRLVEGGAGDSLVFHFGEEAGFGVDLALHFSPDGYTIGTRGRVRGIGAAAAYMLVEMGPTLRVNEANPAEDHRALAYVTFYPRAGVNAVRLAGVDRDRIEEGPLTWAGIKNKYFLLVAIRGMEAHPFGGLIARNHPLPNAAALTATLPADADGRFAMTLYAGPQEFERLVALGDQLQDVNPYGWRVFRPIIKPLAQFITWALVGMHSLLGVSYGWVLILFGILIRVVLWPLNARAGRAQLKNMELQPRMKEIQEKYKKEPERLQKEMLKLYKEEGFNPFGGCLPLLIPFPVLITLFFVFQGTIEFRGVPFLWLPDLSRPDPIYILPVVLGASMFAMQWLSMRTAPSVNPQMKMMLWFMPIFMVIIFLNLASGLNLYYASQNLASIPQQLQLVRERRRAQERQAQRTPKPEEESDGPGAEGDHPGARKTAPRPRAQRSGTRQARRRRSE